MMMAGDVNAFVIGFTRSLPLRGPGCAGEVTTMGLEGSDPQVVSFRVARFWSLKRLEVSRMSGIYLLFLVLGIRPVLFCVQFIYALSTYPFFLYASVAELENKKEHCLVPEKHNIHRTSDQHSGH